MTGTNQLSRGPVVVNSRTFDGRHGYTGEDMYSPLRKPVDPNMHGPWRTDLSKADKPLQDVIAKNEDKWQFYIDDALNQRSNPERAEDMAQAAIGMGRPDIADKIRAGQKSGRSYSNYKPYQSYYLMKNQNFNKDMSKFMDHTNRQTEKTIREQFSMVPDELKQEFSQRYGTWDLFEDWQQNPAKWTEYQNEVKRKRRHRTSSIRSQDRRYGRNVER